MTSKTRFSHRHQCRKATCRARFRLKKRHTLYKNKQRCPVCGTTKIRSIEAERRKELAKQERCHCPRYPFPHKAGSLRMCEQHPQEQIEPTDDDWLQYDACMRTPRSG